MDSLGSKIESFLQNKKNPTSQRAHLIQHICDTLFDDTHFKKILGQTKQFTVSELHAIFDEARSWNKNPQALFWKLIREKQAAIRDQISSNTS